MKNTNYWKPHLGQQVVDQNDDDGESNRALLL